MYDTLAVQFMRVCVCVCVCPHGYKNVKDLNEQKFRPHTSSFGELFLRSQINDITTQRDIIRLRI
jgi:hypothetical protein